MVIISVKMKGHLSMLLFFSTYFLKNNNLEHFSRKVKNELSNFFEINR